MIGDSSPKLMFDTLKDMMQPNAAQRSKMTGNVEEMTNLYQQPLGDAGCATRKQHFDAEDGTVSSFRLFVYMYMQLLHSINRM